MSGCTAVGLRRAIGSAQWALRAYAASTAMITLAGALALAGALVVIGSPLIGLPPVREADLGIVWSTLVVSPMGLDARAVGLVSSLLFGLAVSVLVVGIRGACLAAALWHDIRGIHSTGRALAAAVSA